jgi:hypothetical protein
MALLASKKVRQCHQRLARLQTNRDRQTDDVGRTPWMPAGAMPSCRQLHAENGSATTVSRGSREGSVASREMVTDNFLYSAAMAFFWFTDMRAKQGQVWTANHQIWDENKSVRFPLSVWIRSQRLSFYKFISERTYLKALSICVGPLDRMPL